MTTITLAPLADYPVQTTNFGPTAIPNGLSSIVGGTVRTSVTATVV